MQHYVLPCWVCLVRLATVIFIAGMLRHYHGMGLSIAVHAPEEETGCNEPICIMVYDGVYLTSSSPPT